MRFFDTHFHCDANESPESFTERCEAANVAAALACGGDFQGSLEAERFAERSPLCFFAAGVHPQEAAKFEGPVSKFKAFAGNPKLAAIGEIGLDYHYSGDTREIQKSVFRDLLGLSLELKLPSSVHCRDAEGRFQAYEDAYLALSEFSKSGGRFVLHCFTGSKEWAAKFAELGAYFGIGGIITFKKAEELRSVVASLPEESLLLETDAPYLAPVPHRGKPNHSELIPLTAKALAELRGKGLEEMAETVYSNSRRFLKGEL